MRVFSAIGPVLGVLLHGFAAQAAVQGLLTASLGPGLDTNPSQTVGGGDPMLDGYLGLSASGKLKLAFGDRQQVSGRYDVGLRKFFQTRDEDLAVQQVDLDWVMGLGRLAVGAEGAGKWRVSWSGSRNYADVGGNLFLDAALHKQVGLRVAAGVRGFIYPPAHRSEPIPPEEMTSKHDADGAYDWVGPHGSAALRWQPARRHTATLALFGTLPYYNGWARYEGSSEFANGVDGYPTVRRRDAQFGGQVSYGYRGPVAVQAGYSYVRINSTSYGEASERHRFWAAGSAKLPLRLYASLKAAYEFIRYPDGVFLSQDLLLLDDESQSSVGAKLAFAATDEIDIEARYAAFWISLPPVADPTDPSSKLPSEWWRHTAYLGVAFRL